MRQRPRAGGRGHPGYLRRALDAGAAGYLLKDASSGALANASRRCIQAGAINPDLAAQAWVEPDPLTNRQRHVLRLAREGSQERPWTTSRAVEDCRGTGLKGRC